MHSHATPQRVFKQNVKIFGVDVPAGDADKDLTQDQGSFLREASPAPSSPGAFSGVLEEDGLAAPTSQSSPKVLFINFIPKEG